MSAANRKPRYGDVPETLQNVMRFSDERGWCSPRTTISRIKGMPPIMRALEAMRVDKNHGRKRNPGCWPLAYLVWVMSGWPDIQRWYNSGICDDPALWKLMGFDGWVPAYSTVYERFVELEGQTRDFQAIADRLIQDARRRDPRIGRWVHLDATEAETHSSPVHDCGPGDHCPTRHGHGSVPHRLERPDHETVKAVRQAAAELPEDDTHTPAHAAGHTAVPITKRVEDPDRGGVRFFSGGHWWFTRDREAGLRAYTDKGKNLKAWFGYYNNKLIDHYTRATIAVLVHPADVNEATVYPEILEQAIESLGATPLWMAGDRGLATRAVYERNTRLGICGALPYRRDNGHSPVRPPSGPTGDGGHPRWDRFGRPLCQHCGGPTDHKGFSNIDGKPRIGYRCALPQTPACEPVKKISCTHDFRALVPHPRESEAFAAMSIRQKNLEGPHDDWRDHYGVAGNSLKTRPKRIGMAWQQLRATAALVLEWLWVHARMGWTGQPRAAKRAARPSPQRLARRLKAMHDWMAGGALPRPGAEPPG
jgi:hypothetical protein